MFILICGRSRAGKTTYSKQFKRVIHLDYFGYGEKAYICLLDEVSDNAEDIYVDGIYDTPQRRMDLLSKFKDHDKKTCIWIDTSVDVISQRLGIWKPKNFPPEFEPPTLDEGWDEIRIIRDGEETDIIRKT